MTDTSPQLDAEQIKAEATQAATEQVEKLKQGLIESIQGEKKSQFSWEEKGKDKPETYNELFEEVDKRVVKPEDVDKMVEQKLEARTQAEKEAEEAKKKEEEETFTKRKQAFDEEWYDLVQQGKMPKVADEVQERINKNEKLTPNEIMADEGLKARLELAQLSTSTGKGAKVAFYEDYDKQPAGASAPVLGGRPTTPQGGDKELDYEDVAKSRKQIYGF